MRRIRFRIAEALDSDSPTGMAALAYFDGMRTERLPGALVQCLRDCLKEEGFERIDKKGEIFSCRWTK